ncbi:Very-long-chain (3R)-3-hydroxyacyl-[acyl-carrier protein] dehydratase PASTICCINO 2A [Acorus calamus]|uniref:Very-long-chain (3R)-3-hydroxyacyl-CoA dehydratase n=1 Tax=Acorus calamus TaxID=4465 RepID=A0AAV9CAB9_ACOCL|nr:Very-long-chain (3R)-3-hydroxyacyl-[acyl-carrier protein] dehydratase PASTICCINO 2A [Acorus calamus]
MSSLSKLYLLIYNSLQSLGWGVALTKILISLASERSFHGAYASAGDLICLVPSGALFPLMQWGGRTHFLLAIVRQIPEIGAMPLNNFSYLPTLWDSHLCTAYREIAATSQKGAVSFTTERSPESRVTMRVPKVIRYSHYAVTCVGIHPSWLTYLRYTAFIILYPIGLAPGESSAYMLPLSVVEIVSTFIQAATRETSEIQNKEESLKDMEGGNIKQ